MPSRKRPAAKAERLEPARLFAALAERRGLVLAVSGGADSTALMALVGRWRKRPPVLVATVDHGLRREAAAEAMIVAANAAKLGLPCRILKAARRMGGGNLQDWARRARYGLLVEAAHKAGFDTIVTAHHQDDQAETFLLRLARGSGVYGLAAMREESSVEDIALARPLLGVSRARLAAVAKASGLTVIDDPSNANLRFDRVRMRAALPELEALGLGAARLAQTAGRMRRAGAALDHYAGALLKDGFCADRFGVVEGRIDALAEAPEEVALRALALTLKVVGGGEYTPRLDAVEAVLAAILGAAATGRMRRTLSGAVVTAAAGRLTLRRELGRTGLAATPARRATTLVWDRRFKVAVPALSGTLSVGALCDAARRLRADGADAATCKTLPGLYRNGTLVALPPGVRAFDNGEALQGLGVECLVGAALRIGPGEPSLPG